MNPRARQAPGSVGAILVDFDGTACAIDVADQLCVHFARGNWPDYDTAVTEGSMTLRQAIEAQASMLAASTNEMLAFVLERFAVDPTFVSLEAWARARGIVVAVVSDGFGFYIEPMLAAAGLSGVPVFRNHVRGRQGPGLSLKHPHSHPRCIGCGTCKILVVKSYSRRGPVAFVGEGESDRYGALFADRVFAKKRLAAICERDGIDHSRWETFDDVRTAIEGWAGAGVDAVNTGPAVCPGWTPRPASSE